MDCLLVLCVICSNLSMKVIEILSLFFFCIDVIETLFISARIGTHSFMYGSIM